jgi:hypothetical protein
MANFLNRMTEKMAAQSSRRGFFVRIGAVVGGLATIFAGESLTRSNAQAAGILGCCTGRYCGQGSCPFGTSVAYTWTCYVIPPDEPITCNDCYGGSPYKYDCTYAS